MHVGTLKSSGGAEAILNAINDQTAAILLIAFEGEGQRDVGPIVQGAHQRNIPVLMDGACAVPPKENLWRYMRDLGVDAFITSGGKAIRGPQSTGLVLGRREIIEGCKYHASPNLRIGRGMKVGKEEFAGIYTALKLFLEADPQVDADRQARQIACIAEALASVPELKWKIVEGTAMQIDIDSARLGTTAEGVAKTLSGNRPRDPAARPGREDYGSLDTSSGRRRARGRRSPAGVFRCAVRRSAMKGRARLLKGESGSNSSRDREGAIPRRKTRSEHGAEGPGFCSRRSFARSACGRSNCGVRSPGTNHGATIVVSFIASLHAGADLG